LQKLMAMRMRYAFICKGSASVTVGSTVTSLSLKRKLLNSNLAVVYKKAVCGRYYSTQPLISKDFVVRSPYPDVDIPQTNIFTHIYSQFKEYGNKTALIDVMSEQSMSFNELSDRTCCTSSALCRMGLNKGDVVMMFAPNSSHFAVISFATFAAGAVISTCNPTYTAQELAYHLNISNAKFIATVPQLLSTVEEALKLVKVEKIIVMDETDVLNEKYISAGTLLKDSGSLFHEVSVDSKNDVAILPFSSGTTGFPKSVMLTHYNVVANLCQIRHPDILEWNRDEIALGLLPFFHIYGMVVVLFNCLAQGITNIIMPKFDPELFLNTIAKYKVSIANLVPPIILFLGKHPLVDKYNLSSLKDVMSGAAPLGGNVVKDVKTRLNVEVIRQGYGLTETSPVSHIMTVSESMTSSFSSVGYPIRNQLVKIVDDNGCALGPNAEGQVLIAGPNIMSGYLNQPESTKSCISDDGWFSTGDVGYYDTKGLFYITDRLKELIKVGGLQVAPAELEALLQSHPLVADAAVIGVPDEKMGEAPRAFVVRVDESLTESLVMEYVKQNVAKHKWLKGGVEFIDVVPKSASGKILRRNLRDNV
jgi:acyl-CoA synthetase (AMP-forming)/AMP-acid ligase II